MIAIAIAGTDRTSFFVANSLRIADTLNNRNTCAFSLADIAGAYRPSVGQAVEVREAGALRFAGTIDSMSEHQPTGTTTLEVQCDCVDFNQLADRRLVARAYENQTLQHIVRDIVTQDLAGEGITTVGVQTGPVISKAVFNYRTAAECFDELAELTGFSWKIDYARDLRFFARETSLSPFALTDVSNNFFSMRVERTRDQYRNRQFVRAGQDMTSPRTENFRGDDQIRTFVLAFPVAAVPTVTVNGAARTIGIRGVETGRDFYWNRESHEITHDLALAALATTDVLAVTYRGLFPIILAAQNDAEISARVVVEGGTGFYDAIKDAPDIDTQAFATEKAQGLLRKYGRIPQVVEFETDAPGLAAGHLLSITVSPHGLNSQFLVDSVQGWDVGGRNLRHRVKALSGEHLGGWVEFFRRLAEAGRRFVIRENEVLVLLRTSILAVLCGDGITISSASPERRIGHAMLGFSEVG